MKAKPGLFVCVATAVLLAMSAPALMLPRFVVALALAAITCGQVQAADCEAIKDLPPKRLVLFLRTSAQTADPQCVTEAIIRLGDSKPREKASIEVLIGLLDFRRPPTEREKNNVVTSHDWFPAVPALVSTGKQAVEPLVARLKSNEMMEPARQNGIRALLSIYSGDPPQAVAILKQAAEKADTQVEAVALETCAKEALELCIKGWKKTQCEAALNQR